MKGNVENEARNRDGTLSDGEEFWPNRRGLVIG